MALHLLKLIWNRKRTNLLIITEILLSFIVLAAVSTLGVHYYRNYQRPLGYSYDRIWDVLVRVPRGFESTPEVERERYARMQRLVEAARAMPEVEAVGHLQLGLYRNWQWNSDIQANGRRWEYNGNRADDELATTLSMTVVDGRWFSREDAGQHWDAVVINQHMARDVFGDARAVGQNMPQGDRQNPGDGPAARPQRIVGVVEDFRQFGEYSTPGNYMIVRNDIVSAAIAPADEGTEAQAAGAVTLDRVRAELPGVLYVRVRPGVTSDFEERLLKTMQGIAPDWSFGMQPLENVRSNYNRSNYITPLAVLALLAGFLLVMVALGLSGVLWQNVTQRIRELGLRRAKGADRQRIRQQIFIELALMTTLAIAGGLLLLVQVPVMGWLGPVPPSVYATALALAAAAIMALTAFCGWYPSLLATRVPPAEALRYE
jgi:putative ABC transport system permease protein